MNGRPAPGHFAGCFYLNRKVTDLTLKRHEPIVATKQQKDVDLRRNASRVLFDFIDWYFHDGKIHLMSPKRILEILREEDDVRRLLGQDGVKKLREAAEVMSS